MVEERVASSLEQYEHNTVQPDMTIYLKPTVHATQKDFVALTAANYRDRISQARSNYQKRKKMVGPFVVEVFVFAAKKTSHDGIRRATVSRVLQAAQSIDQYLVNNIDIHIGEIARTHWAVTHARHPEDAQLSVPDTATFRQAQYLDEMRTSHDREQLPSSDFWTVTVRLNGSSDLQLSININELRAALGLPGYNLTAEGIFHSFVPPEMPVDDVEDVDHMSD